MSCITRYVYSIHNKDSTGIILATSDGGGDGIYDSVSIFEKGKLTLLSQSRTSLIGKIYSQITLLLGMNPHRHPYKRKLWV